MATGHGVGARGAHGLARLRRQRRGAAAPGGDSVAAEDHRGADAPIELEPDKNVDGPPIANLFRTMMQNMGVDDTADFGDSTDTLDLG